MEELTCHPRGTGKWSACEILEHLNLTYLGTIKNLERCLAAGKPGGTSDRGKKRWQRLVVLRLGIFPPGRKSPERVLPRGAPLHEVMDQIQVNLSRMDAVITECETRFLEGQPIAEHPIIGPLTAWEWRRFHSVHGRHHVKQIWRLRRISSAATR